MGWILSIYLIAPHVVYTEFYETEAECRAAMVEAIPDNDGNLEKITCTIGID